MHGIDISNHQGRAGYSVPDGIDFCIVKATEGNYFVDEYCDGFVQQCKAKNIKWGFYHFNGNNEPEEEAQFFYDNCKGYIGEGIPILDYEVPNYDNVNWCERFLNKFHDLSGVWPMIYMSEIYPIGIAKFAGSWIPQTCGLWVANYNRDYWEWPNADDCPTNPYPWDFVAIWQFASDFNLAGWQLDADLAFMDREAWDKYAGKSSEEKYEPQPEPEPEKKILTGRVTIELD